MVVALVILIVTIAAALIAYAFLESELSTQAEKTLPLTPFVPETEELCIEDDDALFAALIRLEHEGGDKTYAELAEEFRTSSSTIGRIVRKEWRA